MARPLITNDVKNRTIAYGQIDLGAFSANPALLKAVAVFTETLVKHGHELDPGEYSTHNVSLMRPCTEAELESQLRYEQSRWDELKELYEICCISGSEPESHRRKALVDWCVEEGLVFPWERAESDTTVDN